MTNTLLSLLAAALLSFVCATQETTQERGQTAYYDSLMASNAVYADTLHPVTFINGLQKKLMIFFLRLIK